MPDGNDTIETAMSQPKRVEIDGQVVEQRTVSEMVEADRYVASKKAMSSGKCPLRIFKMEAGGAIR